jgi:hypothetical protein
MSQTYMEARRERKVALGLCGDSLVIGVTWGTWTPGLIGRLADMDNPESYAVTRSIRSSGSPSSFFYVCIGGGPWHQIVWHARGVLEVPVAVMELEAYIDRLVVGKPAGESREESYLLLLDLLSRQGVRWDS